MLALAAALTLSAAPPLDEAIRAALAPNVRAEIVRVDWPRGCTGRPALTGRLERSGRVPLRITGEGCQAFGWLELRLFAHGWRTNRRVAPGELLASATEAVEVELTGAGQPLAALPDGATAKRALPAGLAVTAQELQVGPPSGTPITVRVVAAGLLVEQQGTLTTCAGLLRCAQLGSGKIVRGELSAGALVVSAGGTP